MVDVLEQRRFHVLATLAEGPGQATCKVIDPESGAIRVARLFLAATPHVAPELRRASRDLLAARTVESPALAAWRDAGEIGGHILLLRDWVDARNLAQHPSFAVEADPRSRGGRAGEAELVALLAGILEGLAAVHDRGLVAGRVTPANLFMDETGRVLLTDWGVRLPPAPAVREAGRTRSQAAVAPEVRQGAAPDPRSDLWAAGAVVFEIALGRAPGADIDGSDPVLESLGPTLGPVLRRLLESDPGRRLASARAALAALDRPLGRGPSLVSRSFRSPRLLGRDAELQDLRDAVDRVEQGQGELVFVRGEAGVGKTRLLEEVARYASVKGVAVLRGGATDPSGHPLGRFVPCFEAIARDRAHWSQEEIAETLSADGRVMLEISPSFHDIAAMRRMPEPAVLGAEASRRRLLRVAARALSAYACRRGALIVLEDLESADALSLDLVRYLARTAIRSEAGRRSAPLLVVASYNEDAEAKGPLRAAAVALRAKGLAREIVLKPLAPHEVRDFLIERLGASELPGAFTARMMTETGGLPLRIEETLSWLAGQNVLDMPPETWGTGWELALRGAADGGPARDTDSLSILLGTSFVAPAPAAASTLGLRLRQVRGDARRVLEVAALAGERAPMSIVRMASGLAPESFDAALAEAAVLGALVEERPEVVSFRHTRLAEAIAAGMDPAARRQTHSRIGIALEQHVGLLDERTPLLLAHHFHLAGDVERSLLYLPLAARILKDRHVPNEALALFRRFFRHLETIEPERREEHLPKRLQALQSMAETLAVLGRAAEAQNLWREMAAVAEAAGRERDLVAAWTGLAAISFELNDLDSAQRFAERAADLARRRDLAVLVAENLMVLGRVSAARGKLNQAIWEQSAALRLYREQGDPIGEARALLAIGEGHAARYRYRPALSALRKAYRQFRSLDDKVGISEALNWMGRVQLALGDAGRAVAYHREAARIEREADDREGLGRTLDRLGEAFRERHDLGRAEETFKEAIAIKRELADVRGSADSLLALSHVLLQAGRIDEASVMLEQTLTLARRTGNARAEIGALVRQAQARLQRGDAAGAAEAAEEGRRRAQLADDRAWECRAALILASSLVDPSAAMRAGERAAELARQVGLSDLIFRAEVRLGDLLRDAGQEEAALAHYTAGLDAASALVAAARSAREGFLRREEVRSSLEGASRFLAARTGGEPAERFPVLRLAREVIPVVAG